ncbi:serine/threonine-protein kinase gin4 [Rhizina undulata]
MAAENLQKRLTNEEQHAEEHKYYALYSYWEEELESFSGPVHQQLPYIPWQVCKEGDKPNALPPKHRPLVSIISSPVLPIWGEPSRPTRECFTNRSDRLYEGTASSSIENSLGKITTLLNRRSKIIDGTLFEVQDGEEIQGNIWENDGHRNCSYSDSQRNYSGNNSQHNPSHNGNQDNSSDNDNQDNSSDDDNQDNTSEDNYHGNSTGKVVNNLHLEDEGSLAKTVIPTIQGSLGYNFRMPRIGEDEGGRLTMKQNRLSHSVVQQSNGYYGGGLFGTIGKHTMYHLHGRRGQDENLVIVSFLKEVIIAVEIRVYDEGRNYGHAVMRFAQESGAASSFSRIMEISEQCFTEKHLLVTDKAVCGQMQRSTFTSFGISGSKR